MVNRTPTCTQCNAEYSAKRAALGYRTCMSCGETASKGVTRTIAPLSKSNYVLVTDPRDLRGLNPKTPN